MATKDRITRPHTVRKADDEAVEAVSSNSRNDSAEDIRTQVAEHIGALRFVNGALIVCVQALQQQDADNDAEIALVLQRTVGDKLDATIDRIEAIALGIDFDELEEAVA
jgi:hypothetical protein